ncbi:hypothetical protein J4734_13990 [Klebsiella pneumoniae]|uniref:Uncharacterized protein n=1 Tax=Klebsiella pneumoniae TaxID=573 RepID=A0A939NSE0_KLEPN|nr:hypothetical protein [Klebsiella pneumoniae]
MVSTETCILLPQKITVLGQLWKRVVASQNQDALFKSETHSLSSESSKTFIYKTRHYSGITFVSRERLSPDAAAFFTFPLKFARKALTLRIFEQNKTARRPFLLNLQATYWKSASGCKWDF